MYTVTPELGSSSASELVGDREIALVNIQEHAPVQQHDAIRHDARSRA